MKPSELFGVVVRSLGLLLLVSTLNVLLMAMEKPGYLFIAIPMFAVGAWMLRGAPFLIEIAYPEVATSSWDDEDGTQ